MTAAVLNNAIIVIVSIINYCLLLSSSLCFLYLIIYFDVNIYESKKYAINAMLYNMKSMYIIAK